MSRAAAAAYDYGEYVDHGDYDNYQEDSWRGLVSYLDEPSYTGNALDMPGEFYATRAQQVIMRDREMRAARARSVALAIGLAALLALGLALASPVIARAMAQAGGALVLSRYTEIGDGVPAPEAPAVIDASSGAVAEAPPAPEAAPPAAPASGGRYEVTGPPSLSVEEIERVLAKYGSPAQGNGQMLYDLGVRYGIDPAYALAFFVHESGCGTKGVARFTMSIGNIRWSQGYENYEGYRKYGSWAASMEDWYKLITDLYIGQWGLRTVDAIIPVYAPAADSNHPPSYISSVKAMVDNWRGK
jgi:hypothetical protein